ncbi:MAG: TonB-dependent receptor, partial [Mucilaginibacter polytrichastri]|nr:TonB-dependent receptor [Mucilaginibacter polytrichastri]
MKFNLLLLLCFFCPGILSAQLHISGEITLGGQSPAAFATVFIKTVGAQKAEVIQTDERGHFTSGSLADGQYELGFSFIGYKTVSQIISLRRDTMINVSLQPEGKQLEEITVKSARPVIRNTPQKVVYDVQSSVTAAGSDALTEIGKIPGVRMTENELSVAGKGSVKVMVNGQLLQLSGVTLMRYLKSISAGQMGSIELIKNPPAGMDAEGNAGLININTRRSTQRGYTANFQTGFKKFIYDQSRIYG